MTYPKTGSLLFSNVQTGLSTQIIIKAGFNTIGAIQQLKVNQRRDIKIWEEIGTDGIVESHPIHAAQVTLDVTRIVFDNLRIAEAFGRGFINLQAQRIPFDVQVIDTSNTKGEIINSIIHVFHNCWFKDVSTSYQSENFIITETAALSCEYVTTTKRAESAVEGGARGITYEYDSIERETDTKGRRGRFDSTGMEP